MHIIIHYKKIRTHITKGIHEHEKGHTNCGGKHAIFDAGHNAGRMGSR